MWSTIKFVTVSQTWMNDAEAFVWGVTFSHELGRAEMQPKHLSCFQKHKKEKLYCFDHIQFYMLVIERG